MSTINCYSLNHCFFPVKKFLCKVYKNKNVLSSITYKVFCIFGASVELSLQMFLVRRLEYSYMVFFMFIMRIWPTIQFFCFSIFEIRKKKLFGSWIKILAGQIIAACLLSSRRCVPWRLSSSLRMTNAWMKRGKRYCNRWIACRTHRSRHRIPDRNRRPDSTAKEIKKC